MLFRSSTEARILPKSYDPFCLYSISVGLVPPFSEFFYAILDHYQVHALHIQPRSIFVPSLFAFTVRHSWG